MAFTTAGCLVWNSILIYVGYYLGINWKEVASISHYLIIAVVAAFIVVVVAYLIRRKKKTRFSK
jgi:membrane protein DedA with SNARE-associated domain